MDVLGDLGGVLGGLEAVLGSLGAVLGPFGVVLGASLGRSWRLFRPSRERSLAIVGSK